MFVVLSVCPIFSESTDLVVRWSCPCKRCECIANVVWMTGWTRPGKEPIKATATNCPNISCLVSAPPSSICSAVTPGPAQSDQLAACYYTAAAVNGISPKCTCNFNKEKALSRSIVRESFVESSITDQTSELSLPSSTTCNFSHSILLARIKRCVGDESAHCPRSHGARCGVELLTQVICLCSLSVEM